MKKWLICLVCLLLTGCAQVYDGPTQERMVVQKLRSVYADEGNRVTAYFNTEYSYDTYGNEVRARTYEGDRKLHSEILRSYDADGVLRKETRVEYGSWFSRTTTRSEFHYDDQGRLATVLHRNFWGMDQGRTEHTYEAGRYSVCTYDETGALLTKNSTLTETGPDGGKIVTADLNDGTRQRSGFDAAGVLRWMEEFRDWTLESRREYGYDDQGRLVREAILEPDGTLRQETTYTYEYNRCFTWNSDGTYSESYYDDQGNLHRQVDFREDDSIILENLYTYASILVPREEAQP